jgi:2-oxoglutarate dehydrogenase E2 component (dihydrolipoamide succinyltransferase)
MTLGQPVGLPEGNRHRFSGSCAQPKSRPGPLACEASHRIKDAGYRRKQERALQAPFNPLISPENLYPLGGGAAVSGGMVSEPGHGAALDMVCRAVRSRLCRDVNNFGIQRINPMAEIRVPIAVKSDVTLSVGRWFKRVGDPVTRDEPIVEIDTDNVTHEIRASVTGVLSGILVRDGGSVERGALLGTITEY